MHNKIKKSAKLYGLGLIDSIDCFPHGILVLDDSLDLVTMNHSMELLSGYSRESAVGVRADFILRSSISIESELFTTPLVTGIKKIGEGDIVNRDRKKIFVRITVNPLSLEAVGVAGLFVVIEDISLMKDLDKKAQGFSGIDKVIGHSKKMLEVFDTLPVMARTDASVLITGETGTGKDFIAEAIHKASRRAKCPFIKINCGALPESLLESELFGYVRGAFTGADRDKQGMFRLADGGTVFLTEIGDLPLKLQVKLLTVLDDKEFFPVGGAKKVGVDVRIIAATHRDLKSRVLEGKFREDLFYRLNVLAVHLPPVREREDDIKLFLDYFSAEFSRQLNKKIKSFSDSAMSCLTSYSYPGNVRELRNIVEYAVNMCDSEQIKIDHLPTSVTNVPTSNTDPALQNRTENEDCNRGRCFIEPQNSDVSLSNGWQDIEKAMIIEALTKTGGKKSSAAELLGWSRSKLWRKIKDHHI